MGVNRSDWIVVGVDIGMEHYDGDNEELYDKYNRQSRQGNMTFIIDGMSGEYFIVGEVIKCVDEEGFGLLGFPINENDLLKVSAERVKSFISLHFKIDNEIEPKLLVFTHWT